MRVAFPSDHTTCRVNSSPTFSGPPRALTSTMKGFHFEYAPRSNIAFHTAAISMLCSVQEMREHEEEIEVVVAFEAAAASDTQPVTRGFSQRDELAPALAPRRGLRFFDHSS